MSTIHTMQHFGPEWMRAKPVKPHAAADSQPPPATAPAAGASSYSALVSPAPPLPTEKRDEIHPFRYSREEMLKIYRDGGGKSGLGLEVERWEGIVREVGSEPVGLREMGEAEKKLFAGPLNSDLRRRQSMDHLSPLSIQGTPGERPRISHSTSSGAGSPLRERFGGLMRRRDSADQLSPSVPRKLSLSGTQPPLSPRDTALPSPRTRIGHTSTFDGVLNSGESWIARRRASEAKAAGNASRDPDGRGVEIREEDEDASLESQSSADPGPRDAPQTTESPVQDPPPPAQQKPIESTSYFPLVQNGADLPRTAVLNGPPPGILDLAAVQWSYLDPQGQLQGPFRADLMQKWYDEGYFTAELLMKRTHLDTEWVAVGVLADLARLAGSEKLFIAPPLPAAPPGLPRSTDVSGHALKEQNAYAGPLQPAPVRSLRSSTLDAYTGGSNPSDSPSSSFGAGRFGDGSPDPNAFGGRASSQYSTDLAAGRFGASDSASSLRRSTFADSSQEPSAISSRFSSGAIGDGYHANGTYSPSQGPWQAPTNNSLGGSGSFDALNGGFASPSSLSTALSQGAGFGHIRAPHDSSFGEVASTDYTDFIGSSQAGGASFNTGQQYSHLHSSPYIPSQEPVATPHLYGQPAKSPIPPQPATQNNPGIPAIPIHSPWGAIPDPNARRAAPLDAVHSPANSAINNAPTAPLQASPWGTTSLNEPLPWLAVSQGVIDEHSWKEVPGHSLTFSNLGQHNQQFTSILNDPAPAVAAAPAAEISDVEFPAKPTITPSQRTKARSKSTAQPVVQPPIVPAIPPAESPSATLSAPSKAAWTKEEEANKPKPSGVTLSLRDIQDAEAKKVEARKQADRERERVARTSVPAPPPEEVPPFVASWGLPTSQAGARAAPAKETAAQSPTTGTAPVWTNATKPSTTKKSMKEIQEEEEKRKKLTSKETVAAAARRAYAESTSKAPPPAAQGGAWTTVGAGKSSTPVTVPARPTIASAASSTSASVPRANGAAAPRPATAPVKAAAPKVEEPATASHEFLRWLNDSLKGLNNTVNVEEIMSMLLSFPLDPDVSTVELISDLIYANSTTLDGRRFAAEFVSKRKADATSRPKGASAAGAGAGKLVSIADVVKSQPKPPASAEWGGFKVVNKKKKGGRS